MSVVGHVANYLIDDKAGIILDAEGTRANRTAEIVITETGASPPPLRSAAPKARWRPGLWCGQAAQMADGSQFSFDAPNELISAFPLVMVPVFGVPLAVILHVASLIKLSRDAP
jgi:hypothetical protein